MLLLKGRPAPGKAKHVEMFPAVGGEWPPVVKRNSNWSASMWSIQGSPPRKASCEKERREGMAGAESI